MPSGDRFELDARRCLLELGSGDEQAEARLVDIVYEELRRRAAAYLRAERIDHTLQPTALVHEAWLRLEGQYEVPQASRTLFTAAAAGAMRRVLVDWARARGRQKRRADGERVNLETAAHDAASDEVDMVDVDAGVELLRQHSPRMARLVELRYFVGLTMEEVAETLGVSLSTVERDWRVARAFLSHHLND